MFDTERVLHDLFPDEIAEEIRSAGPDAEILYRGYYPHRFYPACMQCEGGVYTSGRGLYTEYVNGRREGSGYSVAYLCRKLAHKTFSIIIKPGRTIADLDISVPFRVLDVNIGHYIFSNLSCSAPGDVPPDIASLPARKTEFIDGALIIKTGV